jgi:hypothetical protein
MEHTDAEQSFAQIYCNKFHQNVVLNKAEVESHSGPEQKYGSLCASFHRIHLLSKLLWKSPLQNIIQNGQKHIESTGRTSFTYMYKLWQTLQWFSWNSQLLITYIEVFHLNSTHIM